MFGLESVINADQYQEGHEEYEKKRRRNFLRRAATIGQDPAKEFSRIIRGVLFRAQINSNRNSEVYLVSLPATVSEREIALMFKQSPASTIDLIREKGTKYFSSTTLTEKVID